MTRRSTPGIPCGGIIAAGKGSRLRADGLGVSKPMTLLGGRPLIEHTLERFRAVGIARPSIILNEECDDCRAWLDGRSSDPGVDLIVKSTPTSYESFRLIAGRLAGQRALITTVDCALRMAEFQRFVAAAAELPADAVVLGVSDHVDDEKPLWVTVDPADQRIAEIGTMRGSHVTAGLYVLPAHGLDRPTTEFGRLRDYLGWLVDTGHSVYGVAIPKVFDIDRVDDIRAAEREFFGAGQAGPGA